jgi:hypothetical protein
MDWLSPSILAGVLLCRAGDLRTKSLELLQDGIRCCGPVERCFRLVVGSYELLDPGDQFFDTGEAAAPDYSLRDDPEPPFH